MKQSAALKQSVFHNSTL